MKSYEQQFQAVSEEETSLDIVDLSGCELLLLAEEQLPKAFAKSMDDGWRLCTSLTELCHKQARAASEQDISLDQFGHEYSGWQYVNEYELAAQSIHRTANTIASRVG